MSAKIFSYQFMKRINSALLYNLFIKFCLSGGASWAEVIKRKIWIICRKKKEKEREREREREHAKTSIFGNILK